MSGRDHEDIKQQLSAFSARFGPAALTSAKVMQINDDDTIVVELDSSLIIDDARLKSVINGQDKFILVPTVGSTVLVGRIDNSEEYVVVAVEEITEARSVTGQVEFQQDADGFLIRKGNDNLQKLMIDLLDAILQETHNTYYGPTISLTPQSQLKFEQLKTRTENLLKDAE